MLVKCLECSGEVSSEAKTCPHCGIPRVPVIESARKRRTKYNLGAFLSFVGILSLGIGIYFYNVEPLLEKSKAQLVQLASERLKTDEALRSYIQAEAQLTRQPVPSMSISTSREDYDRASRDFNQTRRKRYQLMTWFCSVGGVFLIIGFSLVGEPRKQG